MGFGGIKDIGSNVCGSSSSSSEEIRGGGRFYECMYCKRGFTNAQALGGHMNIHRKDKVKAKEQHKLVSSESREEDLAGTSANERIHDQGKLFLLSDHQKLRYRQFFPGSNPSLYDDPKKEDFRLFDDQRNHLNILNLSLQIGPNLTDLGEAEENHHQVDLELRLGYAL